MPAASAPTPYNWSDLTDTEVLPDFAEFVWEGTKRKRFIMESLMKNDSVKGDDTTGGKYMDWLCTVGDFSIADHADMGTRTFTRVNTEVNYVAKWSFLETTDAISENDMQFLTSRAARNQKVMERSKKIVEDQIKAINDKVLNQNCESSGNSVFGLAAYTGSQPFFGLPTLFGYGTTTTGIVYSSAGTNLTTVSTTAASATSKEIIPNTTYCGISTQPVNSLSGIPDAMRVKEATSPVLTNWSSTAWNTAAFTTWVGNAVKVVDWMIQRQCRDGSQDWLPDVGVLTQTMYQDFKQAIRGTTQAHIVLEDVRPRSPDAGLYPRFFIPYQGVTISYDIAQPTDVFYLLNTKKARLRYLNVQVAGFDTNTGPYQTGKKRFMTLRGFADTNVGAFKFVSKFGGQIIWEPSAQGASYTFA